MKKKMNQILLVPRRMISGEELVTHKNVSYDEMIEPMSNFISTPSMISCS